MIRLAKTITVEHLGPSAIDTKINIFQLESGLFQAHVLRRRNGQDDWTLQHPTSECTDEFQPEELARAWHRRYPRYFEENPVLTDFMKGVMP